jgi:hypothetical protein
VFCKSSGKRVYAVPIISVSGNFSLSLQLSHAGCDLCGGTFHRHFPFVHFTNATIKIRMNGIEMTPDHTAE